MNKSEWIFPLDFISALRAEKELRDWFDSLSEEEKEADGWDTSINIPPKLMMSILIRMFFNYLMWTNVIFHFNNYGNQ